MSGLRANGEARRPIVVTGGCGFIGCNIADALASRGEHVVAYDNLSRAGAEENAEWLRARHGDRIAVELGDVRDADAVRAAVARAKAVFHLAAQVAVTTSLDDPVGDFEINARGTLNVLEALRRTNPAAPMLFASTNKVYGKLLDDGELRLVGETYAPAAVALARGIGESAPLDFYSPYGCSKGAADQYVRDYARIYGLNAVVMRMSCIYGPRQFGNEDQGWIAHFLLRANVGEPITIFGDGCQVRDALFVGDAVRAWIGALDRIAVTRGRVFNLGGGPGNAVSLRELLRLIAEMHGRVPAVRYDGWRPGDQRWYVSDIRALSSLVGWRPQTPLAEGLRALDAWLKSRFAARAAVMPRVREARA